MSISSIKWLRRLLLTSIYALGVLGTVGTGGGSSESDLCNDGACDCVADPFGCSLPPQPPSTSLSNVNSIAVALDSSDDVYVGGYFTTFKNSSANNIARLNNDGSLDTGFITGTGFTSTVTTIAPANDGSGDVYVGGGFASYDGTALGYIARLNLDGTLDTVFDAGTGFNSNVTNIAPAIDGSGDVYVSGYFTSYNGIAVGSGLIRLNDDGSIDAGFSTGSGWGKEGIAPATDGIGNFYVYVARSTSPGIARLNNDGSIDAGFDTGLSGFNAGVRAIAVATDGSGDIYAAGYFTDYDGTGTNDLARLHSDGLLDSGFVTGAGFVGTVNYITPAIDNSRDIYVGGQFLDYNGTTVGSIARLNPIGTLDTNFDTGIGFNDATSSVALATDGSGDVYVGGYFTRYKSSTADHMARLTAGGAFVR